MMTSLDILRDSFTLYLGAGIVLSCLSAWAVFMAVKVGREERGTRR